MLTEEDVLRFLLPNETAGAFFWRIRAEQRHTGLRFVDDHISLRPGTVLEVAGPHGAGKTEFLIHVGLGRIAPRTQVPAAAKTNEHMLRRLVD